MLQGIACVISIGLWAAGAMSATAADAPAHPLKITVYGSGLFARGIAAEVARRGDRVVALVPASSGPGSVTDISVVGRQIAGEDVVIVALDDSNPVDLTAVAKTVTTAARIVGSWTPRILWIGTSAALKDGSGKAILDTLPTARRGAAAGQVSALAYLRGIKDVQWTYLAPPLELTEGKRTGKFRVGGDELLSDARGVSALSVADFAIAAVNEAEKPQHLYAEFTAAY